MPVCTGAGVPKSGTPAWLILAATAIEFLITKRFPWIGPFLSFIPPFSADMGAFCALDPPDMPEWTAGDLGGILTGQSGDKLQQTIHHVLWYEFCQCPSPETTPAPPYSPPPAVIPTVRSNPLGPCDAVHVIATNAVDWINGESEFNGNFFNYRQLPVGATHQQFTATLNADMPTGTGPVQWTVFFRNAAGTQVGSSGPIGSITNANRQVTATYAVPATATQWSADTSHPGSPNGPTNISVDIDTYCGGPPSSLQPACCPPDPTLVARIENLTELVTLIQRQGVPFAYVPGLEYSGLEGNGVISFSDPILRLRVDLTTLPGWYGMAEGDPDRLFDVGWVSLGTADGMEAPKRITNTPFVLPVRGDITRIGYSLGVGVVATITTYSREP